MKIFIATDHVGYEMKNILKEYLVQLELGYEVIDLGANSLIEGDDYPDYIVPLAESVFQNEGSMGIALGKSGAGEAMCANRISGVRAVVFYGQKSLPESEDGFDIVRLAREHNNANILSIGAGFITADEGKFACELFLGTKFSGDERHKRRLNKFN